MPLFVGFVCLSLLVSLQGPGVQRLYERLMRDYYPLARPVFNESEVLTVKLGISLMQIQDVVRKV